MSSRPPRITYSHGGSPSGSVGFNQSESPNDPSFIFQYVDAKVDGLRSEMKGEMATLSATIREVEAQRSSDYKDLETAIRSVNTSLPSKDTVRNYVLAGFGAVIAAMALFWAVFDTGAGVAGSFADDIMDNKEQDTRIEQKLDKLLEDKSE